MFGLDVLPSISYSWTHRLHPPASLPLIRHQITSKPSCVIAANWMAGIYLPLYAHRINYRPDLVPSGGFRIVNPKPTNNPAVS